MRDEKHDAYINLMTLLHESCFGCPMRESCIENRCPIYRIETAIVKEIEGGGHDEGI